MVRGNYFGTGSVEFHMQPVGGELEYVDGGTLTRALVGREIF